MRFTILLIITVIIQFVFSFYMDFHWSAFLVVNMLISIFAFFKLNLTKKQILINSFFSIFILWLIYLLYIDISNQSILNNRIAALFNFPNKFILLFLQTIFGSLLSLFSSYVVLLFCSNQNKL